MEVGEAAATDREGQFRFEGLEAGAYTVEAEDLGYEAPRREIAVVAGAEVRLDLVVSPEVVELEGIKVVVNRLEERRRRYSGSVRALGPDDLRKSPLQDAYQALGRRLAVLTECHGQRFGDPGCVRRRGSSITPRVYVDEVRRQEAMEALHHLPLNAIHAIESYDGGLEIRVYTTRFMEQVAENPGLLMPTIPEW